ADTGRTRHRTMGANCGDEREAAILAKVRQCGLRGREMCEYLLLEAGFDVGERDRGKRTDASAAAQCQHEMIELADAAKRFRQARGIGGIHRDRGDVATE